MHSAWTCTAPGSARGNPLHLEQERCQLLHNALEDQVDLTNGTDHDTESNERHVGRIGLRELLCAHEDTSGIDQARHEGLGHLDERD